MMIEEKRQPGTCFIQAVDHFLPGMSRPGIFQFQKLFLQMDQIPVKKAVLIRKQFKVRPQFWKMTLQKRKHAGFLGFRMTCKLLPEKLQRGSGIFQIVSEGSFSFAKDPDPRRPESGKSILQKAALPGFLFHALSIAEKTQPSCDGRHKKVF